MTDSAEPTPPAAIRARHPRVASDSPWRRALQRFLRNRMAVASLLLLLLLTLAAVIGPRLSAYGPEQLDILARLQGPSTAHWLGTDDVGRDVFTRLLHGGRVSLLVGLVSATLSVVIGSLLGGLAGFFGGWIDNALMRFTDGMMSIPLFFFMLVIMAVFGSGLGQIVLVIGFTTWMPIARVVRGEVIRFKTFAFVEAAAALGARPARLIFRHLLPQSVPSIIVAATLGIAHAILLESALSYLGLGIQPPIPSWGNMLQNAQGYIWTQPLLALWPGLLIFAAVMAFNSLGDGIRDALDPKDARR